MFVKSAVMFIAIWQGPGAHFLKVLIINGPGKLLPFTLKFVVSIALHLP